MTRNASSSPLRKRETSWSSERSLRNVGADPILPMPVGARRAEASTVLTLTPPSTEVAEDPLNAMLHVRPGLAIPLHEIELRTSRSSGPGGQHANVTASRVEAVFDVGASETLDDAQKARITARCGPRVTASAQDTRSQLR